MTRARGKIRGLINIGAKRRNLMKNKNLLNVVSLMAFATTCVASGVLALNTKVANAGSEGVFHELGASVRVSTTDKGSVSRSVCLKIRRATAMKSVRSLSLKTCLAMLC